MAQWISDLNSNYANGKPQFTSDLKAYTIEHLTSVASTATNSGTVVQNLVTWGSPHFPGNQFVPYPPIQDGSLPNRWTFILNDPLPANVLPAYFTDLSNYVCSHVDDSTVYEIENLSGNNASNPGTNTGSDIIFNKVTWVNTARGVFHGSPQSQVTTADIKRDTIAYASQTITSGSVTAAVMPCYGSVNGGPQFSLNNEAPTYGNTVNNFYSDATADDSLAIYNDVGGYTLSSSYTTICSATVCAQSNVTSSTIKNAAQHPIRLKNNSTITSISDTTPGSLDSGNCTLYTPVNGSPVCVDTATSNFITSSVANCDTYALGGKCPIFFDFDP
jgi:hypothetical protein